MITDMFTLLNTILENTATIAQTKYPDTYRKTTLTRHIALYMDRQSLMAFYPEIHWRIDAEDYMRKQTNDFNLIEYRLNDSELEAFEAWLAREKLSVVQGLNYCAEKLIKSSFTYSEKNNNWCVSLTGQATNRFNASATLTNWSDDPLDAFFMGLFKAIVVFEDGAWKTRKSSQRG